MSRNRNDLAVQNSGTGARLSALKMAAIERAPMARDALGLKITYESLSRPTSRPTQQTDS